MGEYSNKQFYTAQDVASILGISTSRAYKIIQTLNKELNSINKLTISGKVSRTYFEERVAL